MGGVPSAYSPTVQLTPEQTSTVLASIELAQHLLQQLSALKECGAECRSLLDQTNQTLASLNALLFHFAPPGSRPGSGQLVSGVQSGG